MPDDLDLKPGEFRRVPKYHPVAMIVGLLLSGGMLLWMWFLKDEAAPSLVFLVAAGLGACVGGFFALLTKDVF